MDIIDCKLYFYTLPLTRRMVIGERSMDERNGWLLAVILDSGIAGWGEASPLPGISREQPHTIGAEMTGLVEALKGRTFSADLLDCEPPGSLAPSVRCALEMAFWNVAFRAGCPSRLPCNARPVPEVTINGLLWGSDDEVLQRARELGRSGYGVVKFKVGRRPMDDEVSLIHRAAERLGEGVQWRFDANQAWTYEEARRFAEAVSGLNVEYIEEPLNEPEQLDRWTRETGMAVALDESLADIAPEELAASGAIRAVVLKPMLLGGFLRCTRFMDAAARIGAYPVISSLFESGVGIRTLAHFAACTDAGRHGVGLDTYGLLEKDTLKERLPQQGDRLNVERILAEDVSIDPDGLREIENGDGQMPTA